ncbi:hypothetical protein DQM68_16755 [Leptospira mayottensis]|uniref:Uncharacterized protein n=1 Tax=Leptospira mayottensis TaxID=1137606 RepID=A0ABN5NM71_9LEPT|nr:hypothetical protein DQM68_16755 [Leptospira mayottensis]AXR62938.1 hypothetical protein DQM28_00375 [Leptospira mayottensis]AZQ01486.1 hypothetical protein LEP1GSC190_04950 [Leptospira mayottensis 200901116]
MLRCRISTSIAHALCFLYLMWVPHCSHSLCSRICFCSLKGKRGGRFLKVVIDSSILEESI